MLTDRWTDLPPNPTVQASFLSPHRFNVVPAGRRSLKTETRKRKLVLRALQGGTYGPARFFFAAPTRDQAKRIAWKDLKDMSPKWAVSSISDGNLVIGYRNGSELHVLGMDRPERIEGSPWDGGVLDEYANMKPEAWTHHVRPALSDRMGWCDLIGVPEGRNHYYDTYEYSRAEMAAKGTDSDWGAYTWKSADVLPAAEIEAARRELDTLTFQQEYEASFVNFTGRAYYQFGDEHRAPLSYYPAGDLVFCFDFNVAPGVAVVCQEQDLPIGTTGTGCIGEVHIPQNSTTEAVCRKLVADWGEHEGRIFMYGDATGGAGGSAKVRGSDWDIVNRILGSHFGENRLFSRVQSANPRERVRVNAVNSRLKSDSGVVRMQIDALKCPNLVRDLDGVRLLVGGSGEIDKKYDPRLTHASDALGYYIVSEFPLADSSAQTIDFKVV